LDIQNYLDLEQKLSETEANLITANKNLTDLKKEAENKENLYSLQLTEQEKQITKLEQKIKTSKELIFNLRKEIRENQLYFQRELRKVSEDYQTKLTKEKTQLITQYQTQHQQLELANQQTVRKLSEKTFLLSLQETALTDLKTNLAKLTEESNQLVNIFLQQKQKELETVRNTTKKPTTQLREEVRKLEAIAQKEREIVALTK
jgi:CRISPR/Cas system-associated endoribonuclease Cas2